VTQDAIWQAMKTETVGGVPIYGLVGDSDAQQAGEASLALIEAAIPIAPDMAVLDVGCGCGRVALPLANKLGSDGRYLGIDIVPALVGFAARHITPVYPNFQFRLRRGQNPHYERWSSDDPDAVEIEAPPAHAFDLALAFSLFTHLDAPEAEIVLREMRAALRPGGQLFATFFLLTDGARERINAASRFQFELPSPSGGAWIQSEEDPMLAVAYTPAQLAAVLERVGFKIERTLPGAWSQTPDYHGYQDGLLLRSV
jgi:SAM-dependent methyltransferase